ncbi:hypothetical protein K431DRAFT_285119 [Polychaeton citri CBS 116435]|uniref:Uncharacterized protein n=1 Tax=Polychaeton citri CBS 116435 TaxID=1314669 RepID=A0A9P4Q7N3_9PEZI|nr:hypothetical protein K431DRAFT_285119 [Polychaeton citri CBS 116435]
MPSDQDAPKPAPTVTLSEQPNNVLHHNPRQPQGLPTIYKNALALVLLLAPFVFYVHNPVERRSVRLLAEAGILPCTLSHWLRRRMVRIAIFLG